MIELSIKKETEKQLYPLWLIHFLISKLTNQETIAMQDMINQTLNMKTNEKSADEILNKFAKIVEIDKKKR